MNKIQFGILIALLFQVSSLKAQFVNFDFVGHIRGPFTSTEWPQDVEHDNWNYKVTVGAFGGTVDFNPDTNWATNKTAIARLDIFILKTTPNGQIDWVKTIGTTGSGWRDNVPYSVAIDNQRNVYVTGKFRGTGDFNPGAGTFNMTSKNNGVVSSYFILKLNALGHFVWAKKIDVGYYGKPTIEVDDQANVYVAGEFTNTCDFDPGGGVHHKVSLGGGYQNTFLLKLSTQGQFQWVKTFESTQQVYHGSHFTSSSGITTLVGKTFNPLDADPGFKNYKLFNGISQFLYIIQVDANGQFRWAKKIDDIDYYNQLVEGNVNGDVVICADFDGVVDVDPGPGVYNLTGSSSTFSIESSMIVKLDSIGRFKNAFAIGVSSECITTDIDIDLSDNIYLTGMFKSSVDFLPGPLNFSKTSSGDYDIFLAKYSSNFDLKYVESFGGNFWDRGKAISVGNKGQITATGRFVCSVDFDPDTTDFILTSQDCPPYAYNDAFLLNYSCTTNWGNDSISSCGPITWIDGNTYSSDTLGPSFTLTNKGGCDSIVYLHFSLDTNYIETGTNTITSCGPITWMDGNTYSTNNNSATHTLTNQRGCDSIVTLNLVIDSSHTTQGIDKITSCDALTWINGQTYTSNNFSATDTLLSSTGCDSIVTLNLQIKPSKSFHYAINACDSLTWINGQTYHSSTKDTLWLTTYKGCDSIVSMDLYVYQPQIVYDSILACDSITWIDGNTYSTNNNSATHTLTSALGCDSIVHLHLNLSQSTKGTDVIDTCKSYTWIDGQTYFSSTNTPTWTLTNSVGCDSVVTLDLTISNVSDLTTTTSGLVISANNIDATYQWLNCDDNYAVIVGESGQTYTATSNGNYAVELTENGCVDTSTCVAISTVGILENSFGNNLLVYPNPTNGNLSIDLGAVYENSNILITDISGKKIDSINITQSQVLNISLEEPAGIYIISIQAGNKTAVIRLVKK